MNLRINNSQIATIFNNDTGALFNEDLETTGVAGIADLREPIA
jgi:hypothetical protein